MLSRGVCPVSVGVALSQPVILNLFQDPSGLAFCRLTGRRDGAVAMVERAKAHAAKWILKQVQDDENGKGGMVSPVEFVR